MCVMYNAWERCKIHVEFLSERLKMRNSLKDLGIGDRIILK